MPIKIRKLGRKGGPQGQDKVVPPNKKKLTPMPFKKKPQKKPMKAGGMMKKKGYAMGGAMKKKGMSKGGKLKMVEKDGKKVPFFAADGKGKMAAGGRMKKKGMKKGGMMKKGYAKGGSVKVKSGDTLSQIAKSKGLTLKSLMAANPGIKNANEIRVGQSIKMPTDRAAMRSRVAFQNVDKNLNRRDNVYAGMTKSSMKALADDTAAKRAKKSGKPVSKKRSETANKRARVTTRLNQLGEINKQRRAADADKKPRKVKRSRPAIPSNDIAAKKGGVMKAKGYKHGGKMCRGGGAATKGKRFGKAG